MTSRHCAPFAAAFALTVAVAPVATAGLLGGTADQTLLDRVLAAHADVAGVVVAADRAWLIEEPGFDARQKAAIERSARVRRWTDPSAGLDRLILHRQTVWLAGPDVARVESVNLTYLGPEEGATDIELLTSVARVLRPTMLATEAEVWVADPPVVDEQAWRRERKQTAAEYAAMSSYPTFALWTARLLSSANDREASEDGDRVVMRSPSLGLELRFDRTHGEVATISVEGPRGLVSRFEYEGRFAERLLPARHPRIARAFTRRAGTTIDMPGEVLVYTSASRVGIDPARFQPENLAKRFVRGGDQSPCDAQGRPIVRGSSSNVSPTPSDPAPLIDGVLIEQNSGANPYVRRMLLAGAAGALVAGAIVWWKRRHG
ncbi:MAG: hypothetical protein ACT4PL_02630 [Phycisphaerales bacterium]